MSNIESPPRCLCHNTQLWSFQRCNAVCKCSTSPLDCETYKPFVLREPLHASTRASRLGLILNLCSYILSRQLRSSLHLSIHTTSIYLIYFYLENSNNSLISLFSRKNLFRSQMGSPEKPFVPPRQIFIFYCFSVFLLCRVQPLASYQGFPARHCSIFYQITSNLSLGCTTWFY